MPPLEFSKVIAASVVPVALISASALLCLAFYNRLAAIVGRLRVFQRERLAEHEWIAHHGQQSDRAHVLRHMQTMDMLDRQTTAVLRRARHIRATLTTLLLAIACMIICSAGLGLGAFFSDASRAATVARWVAVIAFAVGMLTFLISILFAIAEIRIALDPVELESQFVSSLQSEAPPEAPASPDPVASTH